MTKQLGPTPPSAAMLSGIKAKKPPKSQSRAPKGQEPTQIRDKSGNGELTPHTTEATTMENQDRSERHHAHHETKTETKDGKTNWFQSNAGLSKSAMRDIETIEKAQLADHDKQGMIREIVHNDVVAQGRWGKAVDIIVQGGAFVLVLATGYVVLWALSRALTPVIEVNDVTGTMTEAA